MSNAIPTIPISPQDSEFDLANVNHDSRRFKEIKTLENSKDLENSMDLDKMIQIYQFQKILLYVGIVIATIAASALAVGGVTVMAFLSIVIPPMMYVGIGMIAAGIIIGIAGAYGASLSVEKISEKIKLCQELKEIRGKIEKFADSKDNKEKITILNDLMQNHAYSTYAVGNINSIEFLVATLIPDEYMQKVEKVYSEIVAQF